MAQVPLSWRLAVDDVKELGEMEAPGLEAVPAPHVTLLFMGGRVSDNKVATLNNVPEEACVEIQEKLTRMAGIKVIMDVHRVLQHPLMIVCEVTLPDDVPCAGKPHLTLFRSDKVAPVFAKSLLENPSTCNIISFPEAVRLHGVIELETGQARPGQVREKRGADVAEGTWVRVKKHSSMGCAVVSFSTGEERNGVLARCAQGMQLAGNVLDVKAHMEKQSDGSRVEAPESIFVGWKQPKRRSASQAPLCADDLLELFEDMCAH